MPLHIDYRPESFDEIYGNDETIHSIQGLLESDGQPHTYLFKGPSGCGKTTLARILAAELGCVGINITELNASNNRGIDTAREIISSMKYSSIGGGNRAYILDEVHQTTKDFQNALLKALEDTPPYIYFILCTTEPNKLLKTIINRCHTFAVQPLANSEMKELLTSIMEAEKAKVGKETIQAIIKSAQGSPRSGLISLEQVIGLDEEEQLELLKNAEGIEAQTIDLCRAIQNRKPWKSIAPLLKNLSEDPERVRHAILGYFNSVLLGGDRSAAWVIECFQEPYYNVGKAGLTLSCFLALDEPE